MSQNDELDAVKRKIRAMAEKTVENGATEAEQFVAMKKIGELLERFNLTMDEVTVRQEKCITGIFNTRSKHRGVVVNSCMGIAAFTDTKVWQTRGFNEIALKFFGLESDVQMAIYLCELITKTYQTEVEKFKLTDTYQNYAYHRRTLNANFSSGYSNRVYSRLVEIKRELKRQREEAARYHAEQMANKMVSASDEAKAEFVKQTTGTALVVQEKAKYVHEEFSKLGMRLRTATRTISRKHHADSYHAGQAAAEKTNLSRPLSTNFGSIKLR